MRGSIVGSADICRRRARVIRVAIALGGYTCWYRSGCGYWLLGVDRRSRVMFGWLSLARGAHSNFLFILHFLVFIVFCLLIFFFLVLLFFLFLLLCMASFCFCIYSWPLGWTFQLILVSIINLASALSAFSFAIPLQFIRVLVLTYANYPWV